uniref:B30.2/SPRY domain-containing protein n=1 Tax=Globodera pallida TaxID=36090 RepID=A0A183BTU4_GLOPA
MSISPESTNGHMTTNQEPSEEMQLLLDRIAELLRQKLMNSPTSSDGFDFLGDTTDDRGKIAEHGGNESAVGKEGQSNTDHLEDMKQKQYKERQEDMKRLKAMKRLNELRMNYFTKLEQMEEWRRVAELELENKALHVESERQNLLNAHKDMTTTARMKQLNMERLEQQIIDAKMEEYQKGQKLNIDAKLDAYQKELQLSIDAKMEEYHKEQKLNIDARMEEYQKQLKLSIGANMGEYLSEHRLNIDALTEDQRGNGLIQQQNRWDFTACHNNLRLSEPSQLIVQHHGKYLGGRSVFAEDPIPRIPCGIFYYEVTIFVKRSYISIGFATKQMPLNGWVGDCEGTYAYESDGRFWGHGSSGGSNRRPFIGEKPRLRKATSSAVASTWQLVQIIYTKNGRRLGEK